jgi:2-desacetyl-2-hydroxyethyl bacteriochlorophyllide A dehydrogenase
MRAVTSHQGKIQLVERDIPNHEGELIKISSSGICGSDLHMVEMGVQGVVLGHEFGGYTTDGRLVAVRPTGECGHCSSCALGTPQTCPEAGSTLYGLAQDGGLADYAVVDPRRMYEIPHGVDPAAVGLVEPLAVVVHGINRLSAQPGMRSLVVGAGSIGLLTAAVLRDRGIAVDIVTRHPHQHSAAEALGGHPVATPESNYDITFDAVCTQQSFDTCVNAVRPGGQLLEFGMFWSPVQLNNSVMMKEVTIVPSIFYGHNEDHNDFLEAVDVLARHHQITDTIVTHRFSLDEAEEAFETAKNKKTGAIKVHVSPNG